MTATGSEALNGDQER